ncbi:MAG: DUF4145 domain-containing protein [bacterium]
MVFVQKGSDKYISGSNCPNCGYASTYYSIIDSEDLIKKETISYPEQQYPHNFPHAIVFKVFQCEQCDHQRLIIQRCARSQHANYRNCQTLLEYPYPISQTGLDLNKVPSVVRENLDEGLRCLASANSPKGAIVNFRRSLQAAILFLGGDGKDLFNQIEDLYKKEVIRKKTKEIAHKVRSFGKFGAHPLELKIGEAGEVTEDEFGQLTHDDARQALEALLLFLEDAFVFSDRLAQMDTRIDELENGRENQ